jgi:archaellum component FlaC
MADTEERLQKVEDRLTSVENSVDGLRSEVGGLRGEVGELRGEVGELRGEVGGLREDVGGLRGEVGELRGKTDTLAADVQKLRVLGEENEHRIKLVLEVQADHGKKLGDHGAKLDRIFEALKPLPAIYAFVQSVAHDHEMRIVELEKRAGVRQ